MDDQQLERKIKESFSKIEASEALKRQTKAFLSERAFSSAHTAWPRRRLVPVLACAAVLFLAVLAYPVYFLPTCVISVDINPSLELGVNRFDRVVSVTPMNEDAKALAGSLNLQFLNYEQAVETLVSTAEIQSRLENNELLSITVVEADNEQSQRILAGVERCTQEHQNAHCYAMTPNEAEAAHERGLSYGKYRAFLELQALDPTVTTEDVQGLTMREMREWIMALENPENDTATSPTPSGQGAAEQGQGQGQHHGQGQGHGHAYGKQRWALENSAA